MNNKKFFHRDLAPEIMYEQGEQSSALAKKSFIVSVLTLIVSIVTLCLIIFR